MAIYLIALLGMLCHTAYAGSRVVFSLLAIELGANPLEIGLLVSLYAVCPLLLAIYTGKLIDRFGARAPMFIGILGMALVLLLAAAVPRLAMLYGMALLFGLAAMIFFVAVQSIVGAVGREQDRVRNYGLLSIGFSLAGILGPLVAGFSIDYLGHSNALLILAGCTLVSLLLLWSQPRLVPRVTHAEEKKRSRNVLDLLRVPALRGTFIVSGALSAAGDLYGFYMPIYGRHIGLSASAIGTIMAASAVSSFVIRLYLSAMPKQGAEMRMLNLALFVASTAYFLFPLFQNPWALAAISFLLGLGVGADQPLSLSLIYELVPQGRAGEAAGVRLTVHYCAHVAIPLAFGGIGSAFGIAPVFIVNALMLLTGGIVNQRAGRR